jgi:hypothetical protein
MAITPDPIFFRKLKRNSGGKRKIINLANTESEPVKLTISDIEKPEWLEMEGLYRGSTIEIGPKKKKPVIVDVNTTHKYFPKEATYDGAVLVEFEEGDKLEISVIVQEIAEESTVFRGVFAVDFGTTNSCFAFKGKIGKSGSIEDALRRARPSPEIPSLVFFRDVSNRDNPEYVIGNDAKYDIKEYSGQTYSYFMSVKRILGEDKSFIVLDQHSGSRREHRQKWHVEEISAFIIRDILRRAEEEIGEKITQVVATYPTLFSQDRKQAVRRAFERALKARGVDVDENSVTMHLDETSAAAFNYIYGTLLEEFRKFATLKKECQLLVYDFGGGTVDISLVDVSISRDEKGKLHIDTELKGLSGESYYGGDNVTLEMFKILKNRLILAGAHALEGLLPKEEEQAEETKKKAAEDDIWGTPAAAKKEQEEEEMDVWGAAAEVKKKEEEVVEEEDPSTADIINMVEKNAWRDTIAAILREEPIILRLIKEGGDIADAVMAQEKKDGSFVAEDQSRRRASLLSKAVDTLLPTRYGRYEDDDPMKAELARKLFYDIWHEADMLKIRLSMSEKGVEKVTGVLKKVAKYMGVDPMVFNEVEVSIDDLNRHIEPRITETVKRAHALYQSVHTESSGGLMVRKGGASTDGPELRVILCGNSSNLPIVRKKVLEVFKINESELVMNRKELKTGTAVGACEEYMLRRDFGESGLINYVSKGFLERLPNTLGLFNRELVLQGYDRGFCPVFSRNTEVGAEKVLDAKNFSLIHPGMTELPIYADYHDSALPSYIGWFDFATPSGVLDEFEADPAALNKNSGEDQTGKMYKIRIDLIENRELRAVDMGTGEYYLLIPNKESWKPEEYPFSGYH